MPFYAVVVGKQPGIYNSWSECSKNVTGFSGAKFHKFDTHQEAQNYMRNFQQRGTESVNSTDKQLYPYAYVDGSYNQKTGVYGYGVFMKISKNEKPIEFLGFDTKMQAMRNVAGECEGAIKATEKAIELGLKVIHIYYDYIGIEAWVTGAWEARVPGVIKYRDKMKELLKQINVLFIKVPAHTGVEGNEIADRLAKKAVGV